MARLGTILLLLLLVLPACDGGDHADPDGGPYLPPVDGSAAVDAATLLDENAGGLPGICYDGVDNDADGQVDCEDSGCERDAVCCVGSAACCSASSALTFTIPATCADAAFADCAFESEIVPFGAVEPDFERGALVPQGGTTYGGVALGSALDPRTANVTLSANVRVPSTRCADCIDAAGIAFFDSIPARGERGIVQLGVLVSGSRDEVQVIVADHVVARETITAAMRGGPTPSELYLQITLRVDGTALIDGLKVDESFELEDLELPTSLFPVLFGRTDNRTDEAAVSVLSASVQSEQCDAPSALVRRSDLVLPASSTSWIPNLLGRTSLIDVGTDRAQIRAVFAHDGELLSAGLNGSGQLVGSSGPPDHALSPPDGFESLHDPWLVRSGDRALLFFAAERADGVREIRRASGGPGLALDFDANVAVNLPAEVRSADGPTVWLPTTDVGAWHMIARLDGQLVALISRDDGFLFEWARGSLSDSVVRFPTPSDVFAIDRDEVATPAFVQIGDTWRVYYSARRGNRWSIGLVVSELGAGWRGLGPMLEGDEEGFDALGVLHPAPLVTRDGVVQLYYVGTDGVRNMLGLAGPAGTLGE